MLGNGCLPAIPKLLYTLLEYEVSLVPDAGAYSAIPSSGRTLRNIQTLTYARVMKAVITSALHVMSQLKSSVRPASLGLSKSGVTPGGGGTTPG